MYKPKISTLKIVFFFLIIFSTLFFSCDNEGNILIPPPVNDYSPMWPQPCYNARFTSNPKSQTVLMNPVQSGTSDWSYSFQGGNVSDGSEFCVDSEGNIYYLHQLYIPYGSIYKFSSNGNVLWKIDSLMQNNYCGISINAAEDRIFLIAYKPSETDRLFCIDSSGKILWSHLAGYSIFKPVVRRDWNIYASIDSKISCIDQNGNIIWISALYAQSYSARPALDREDNLYFSQYDGIDKIDVNGNSVWKYNCGNTEGIVIDGYGNIYFISQSDEKLYCLNSSGQVKWTKNNANDYSSPVITGDNVIIASVAGKIIAYDTSGATLWSHNNSGDGLILDSEDNLYYLIEGTSGISVESLTKNGSIRWTSTQYNIGGILPWPVLIPQGKILFAPKRAFTIQALR